MLVFHKAAYRLQVKEASRRDVLRCDSQIITSLKWFNALQRPVPNIFISLSGLDSVSHPVSLSVSRLSQTHSHTHTVSPSGCGICPSHAHIKQDPLMLCAPCCPENIRVSSSEQALAATGGVWECASVYMSIMKMCRQMIAKRNEL